MIDTFKDEMDDFFDRMIKENSVRDKDVPFPEKAFKSYSELVAHVNQNQTRFRSVIQVSSFSLCDGDSEELIFGSQGDDPVPETTCLLYLRTRGRYIFPVHAHPLPIDPPETISLWAINPNLPFTAVNIIRIPSIYGIISHRRWDSERLFRSHEDAETFQ